MAKIPETGKVTIADIAAEFRGPKDLAELSKLPGMDMSGTEQVGIDDFRGKECILFAEATGGTVTTDGDYKIHTFTSNGKFEITSDGAGEGSDTAEVLIIAGGGGSNTYGAGAGAGGMVETALNLTSIRSFNVVVGAGGRGQNDGKDSSVETLTVAKGGGHSTGLNEAGRSGGSGSGGNRGNNSQTNAGGSGTAGQGNRGGSGGPAKAGGGGGGAGSVGANIYQSSGKAGSGHGGDGKVASLNGVRYCGGGGGSTDYNPISHGPNSVGGNAGSGGGGRGGHKAEMDLSARQFDATNYGGGAGGGGNGDTNGYQGIVIFKYKYKNDGLRLKSDQKIFDHAPTIEEIPDHNPETHKPVLNMITDPAQETVGWTIVEMTAEEKAAYLEARAQEEAWAQESGNE